MVNEFYELEVWQMAKGVVVRVYQLTKLFPKQEMFGLVDQLRRAANSVCANIAEGFERYHTKDKIRFYYNELTRIGVKLNNMISSLYRAAHSRDKSP